jgi:hypothetical protein
MTEAELYPIAWHLHKAGLSVIPSGGGESGKQPLIPWTEFQHRRPTDQEMHTWQDELRPELWGVVTGSVVVFDADSEAAAALFKAAGLNPHVRTPRGGAHFHFASPGHPVKTVAGILPGLDVRGDGGFVNVCGSNHAGPYEVLVMPGPESLYSWERLPPEVAAALDAARPTATKESATRCTIPEGRRNETLTSMAGAMRRKGMTEEAILVALLATNRTQCQSPLPETEVRGIAASVGRYPPASETNTGYTDIRTCTNGTLQSPPTNERYRSVTDSFCNGDTPEPVTESTPEASAQRVLDWIRQTSGWWSTQELDADLGFRDTQAKNYRRLILHRLKEQGIVEPHPRVNKQWRFINKKLVALDFKKATSTGVLPLKWPFAIENLVNLYPGSLVAIAGFQNAGKTAFVLNFIRMNQNRFPIVLFSSEGGEDELKARLKMFPDMEIEDWRFRAYDRTGDFHDVVIPDIVNVIDYLEISKDFYEIGAQLTAIRGKIGTGLAIVTLQKAENAILGRGASFGLERPRLYLSMDRGKLTVVKGKSWADPKVDPNGLSLGFKITGGCEFVVTKPWGAKHD